MNIRRKSMMNRRSVERRSSPYSQAYIDERRKEMEALLAEAKSEFAKKMIVKAFDVSINP